MSDPKKSSGKSKGLDIVHLSLHGLIRGENMELGRDPDTGGQCLYVVELVKALAQDERVHRVSLLTRKVMDPRVSADYSKAREKLEGGGEIIRIEAGPRRYLRKEVLWRHLDAFIDGTLAYFRREKRVPDIIHAHYGDAGYVGRQLSAVLGCPFVFTGHSLGRVKRQKLEQSGATQEEIEERYNLSARIEAEELSLDAASMVCTSTRQEVEEQYSLYHQYAEERMRVIPPGVNLSRFDGPGDPDVVKSVDAKLCRFLNDPTKPPVLTIARADERKNLPGLVKAFSENPWLRENANLILIGGNRETFEKLPQGARRVWRDLLRTIDDGDLYGSIAYPKRHESKEVAGFYRWAAERGGVFVNPAFTEPFGLTLLEAAAAGLPLVATNDGGPRDILANCKNGELVDPYHTKEIGDGLERVISDPQKQKELAARGHAAVRKYYAWSAHVDHYLNELKAVVLPKTPIHRTSGSRRTLVERERWIVMDLLPNIETESEELLSKWRHLFDGQNIGLGIATGLSFDEAWEVISRCNMPEPGFIISGLGAEIRYGRRGVLDERWRGQLASRWDREKVLDAISSQDGIYLQEEKFQHRFKVSFLRDPNRAPSRGALQRLLREAGVAAKVIVTARSFLDVIPIHSGKDVALRYLEHRWGIDPARIYYFGNYGNDVAAVRGRNLSAVPSDADRVLRMVRERPRLFQAQQPGLAGFFEGLDHYGFLEGEEPPKPVDSPVAEETVDQNELHP
ncbi:glycosyltransferase [Luteolibacter pohnpeiensis]|uniref:sucrose-phosphate synthase n=1 Tax=Luteolibacter pohnpeiensis TaxID=454153 RepID=A0A934S991_9BACT|nr:HAD family hydrolase [Luteolibacter pohnpeiensis]MBK1881163.1 glycosyltransferase [Luteolibacter pohnpeiensis]